jgi:hypothetical protein
MKVFTISGFKGHWPVGTMAIVVAETVDEAAAILAAELTSRGLMDHPSAIDFSEIDTTTAGVKAIKDGDY